MIEFFYIIFWFIIAGISVFCAWATEDQRDRYRQIASKQNDPILRPPSRDRRATSLQIGQRED